jgi:hypothetical protein
VISFFATTRRENSIAKCALSGRLRTMVTGHADGVASRLRENFVVLCAGCGQMCKTAVGPDRTISCRRRSERRGGEPRAGKHPHSGEHELSESRSHFSDHRTFRQVIVCLNGCSGSWSADHPPYPRITYSDSGESIPLPRRLVARPKTLNQCEQEG